MQILTEAEAEAEEFWQKKMLKKGHCLGSAQILSFHQVMNLRLGYTDRLC